MSFLDSPSERVVRGAVEEFLGGALKPHIEGELVLETANSRYRFLDGVCFGASDDEIVGAELVGWLLESERSSAVSAWWRRGARAVLVIRRPRGEIVVTSQATALFVEGRQARDGFATQQARFVVHRERTALEGGADGARIDRACGAAPMAGDTDDPIEEISVELDPDDSDAPSLRASSPADDQELEPLRLPTAPLPIAPEVARRLGPRTLPPVTMPPQRPLPAFGRRF